MYNLSDIDTIKSILSKNGFTFSKSLGQNFIIDENVCPDMASFAVTDNNMGIIEVGAGVGVLTAELSKKAKKVVSVELDKRLLPVLSETLSEFDNVEIVNDDIMKIDLNKLIKEKFGDMKVSICANLPYYITSPVIMRLLEEKLPVEDIVVMVQKEAADRICAEVGSRESGALTVAVKYFAETEKLFFVPKNCFIPSPKVDSTVIRLKIRKEAPIHPKSEKLFWSMVKAAFAQRRKTALNSLSAGMGLDKSVIALALEKGGFSPDIRAEKLTLSELEQLSDTIFSLTEGK